MTPAEAALDETVMFVYQHTVNETGEKCHAKHSVSLRQIILAALADPEIKKVVGDLITNACLD